MQPKLRMISDGSTEVNVVRAEHSSVIAVRRDVRERIPLLRGEDAVPVRRRQLPKGARRGRLRAPADAKAHVFVHLVEGVPSDADVLPLEEGAASGRRGDLIAVTVPISKLPAIAAREEVNYIELGQPLAAPVPEVTRPRVAAPSPARWRFGSPARHRYGDRCLIGIIDVGGFDFAHPDFLDDRGGTRFISIWDQAGRVREPPSGEGLGRFAYGSEFRREHLNRAIREARRVGAQPQDLEPQSQMGVGSHGTHVASIAAGNRGLCRGAKIAGVLVSLASEDLDRRATFADSVRIAQAVDYLVALAERERLALSINISLGTNGHAHDGSSPVSRWLDHLLTVPGRNICVAAGNAGQEVPAFEGDIGYVMGRIHTSGRIPANELYTDIEWVVVGNSIADISENELEVWFGPQDRFAVEVKPPDGDWIGPVEPQQYVENRQRPDGSFVSIYNELYHPANGCNYIAVYLSPFFSRDGVVGVPSGQWTIRLRGREVRDGSYHAWIERDDPRRQGRIGRREAWSFPSFFSERSVVDDTTVSSLACGNHVIAVGNLDEEAERINITSSQGPTRDGRFKPDIAAPGTDVVAAKGFAGEDDPWIAMTGTSMAAPFVTGVAGLMLSAERRLTAAQIGGILQRTARPLPGGDFQWKNDVGFGAIDPDRCLSEVEALFARRRIR